MTRLFIRFYLGVLLVLFVSWYIHGRVSEQRSRADVARVVTGAHGGGARLVAQELDAANSVEQRDQILADLNSRFEYRVQVIPVDELRSPARQEILGGADIAFDRDTVVGALANEREVVRLGAFPNYTRFEIEDALAGWMRLTKERMIAVESGRRSQALEDLQSQFEIPIELAKLSQLPAESRDRLSKDDDGVVFYSPNEATWYSAIILADEDVLRFGPYPIFEDIQQNAATTTLALVLLPAAFAIALLLRPVARQLRQLENAAEAIAGGDLSARVDQQKMNSAKPLAQAFNHMAMRTETLVRTQRELLQAVSHELRTPLARMRFAIDLVGAAATEEERAKRLRSLDDSTEELNSLVGELLSYVRLETGEPTISQEFVSVQECMDAVFAKFSAIYPGIQFECAGGDLVVWADRTGFQRAMSNLVGNAGRYAKSQVNVTACLQDDRVVIDVDDDGPGIPAADRERVFEPFVRLGNDPGKDQSPGVGLGLALVHRIVNHNAATIEVADSPLGGCRFRSGWPKLKP